MVVKDKNNRRQKRKSGFEKFKIWLPNSNMLDYINEEKIQENVNRNSTTINDAKVEEMKGVCVLKEYWRAFTNNKNQQQNNQSNKLQKLSNQPRMKGRK